MPVWLVTGGSGFLGRHLLAELSANLPRDVSIEAIGRSCPMDWAIEAFRKVDLEDRAALAGVLEAIHPSQIFHLAGKTPPGSSDDFDRLNTSVTIGLVEVLQALGSTCRVVLVGSAAELGPVPVEDLPVAEIYPCRPLEPYGRSKLKATLAGLAASPPMEVMVARVFNPIGPGLPASQALGRFARLLAEGSGPVRLEVGDLDARRDFVDVRDVAAGLLGLALRGRPGEVYHLGTGQSHAIREGLDRLIALSGRDVTVEVDPALARNRGPSDSRADVRKILKQVGWSPKISWDRSLVDLWGEAIGSSRAGLTDPRALV
jgi:nucleoside-diphosphate-sugar epimerase